MVPITFSAYVNTKGRMLDKNWLSDIDNTTICFIVLYKGAATVSPLIEEIIPCGKRFGTRKFCFQHTGITDVLCEY